MKKKTIFNIKDIKEYINTSEMNIKCLNKEHVRNKTECLDIKVLLDTNTVVKKKNLGNRAINNR